MSVFKRKGAEEYEYDFQYRNHRFCGRTGEKNKRAAERVEATKKEEARQSVAAEERRAKAIERPAIWEVAASRYWHEVGQHHKNAKTTFACLAWLTRELGPKIPLLRIDDNRIALLVAKRRNELRRVGRPENSTKKVGPATVNRTVTEPLRKVLLRAQKVWRSEVANIDWRSHRLEEPQERVREGSYAEEADILSEMGRGYEEAMLFAFRNGVRRMEIISFKKTMVDFFSRQFTVIGKGGRARIIPMSDQAYAQLWRLKDAPTEYVFSYVAARTDKRKEIVRGQSYPLTDAGLRSAQRRAIKKSGVTNFRPHDTRHTAATRVSRSHGIRVAQKLLGHSEVTTTTKYAHVMQEDVRAALNAATPVESPVRDLPEEAKMLDSKVKQD